MSNETNRKSTILKICGFIFSGLLGIYSLMYIFAPHHLQRFGAVVRGLFRSGQIWNVTMATSEEGGHYYRLGNLFKKEMQRERHQRLDLRITSGTLENIGLLRSGDVDFALIQGGVQESANLNFKSIAAVAALGWQYVHILVPNNSTIHEFKDLSGKKVSLGPAQSGSAALGKLVFEYFPPSSRINLLYTEIQDAENDFKSGNIEALFAIYDFYSPLLRSLMETGRYRLVPIHEAEAIAQGIPGCFASAIPHSMYGPDRNIPSPQLGQFGTLKVRTLLVCRNSISPFVVQAFLTTLYSARFVKLSRLPELTEDEGRRVFDLPLHPAADRYYRRNDPVTADKYEIGSAFLALLVFVSSVLGYIINRYKMRMLEQKKKNIIPYFEELLLSSIKLTEVNDIEQLKKILDDMMSMQSKAEKEWLEGELDTEHMENLYSIYGIRCDNAFNKMTLLQLIKSYELMEATSEMMRKNMEENKRP